MSKRVSHLRHLSLRERQALNLIRRAGSRDDGNAETGAFASLALRAEEAGLIVLPAESPFVHEDEKELLTWLTRLQRQRQSRGFVGAAVPDRPIFPPLRECAQLLDEAGIHLSYHAAWRGEPLEHPLMDRVASLLADKDAVATQELKAAGVSPHAIGVMRKTGLLSRVRYGLYALGPAMRRQTRRGLGVAAHA